MIQTYVSNKRLNRSCPLPPRQALFCTRKERRCFGSREERKEGADMLAPVLRKGTGGEGMSQEIVHVVAIFVAAPGKENELEELLSTLVEPTRKEAGCIKYDLLRGIPGESGDFVFV